MNKKDFLLFLGGWILLWAAVGRAEESVPAGAGAMALIPAGEVRLGQPGLAGNPLRTESGPAFRLGCYEVTVADFCEYLSAAQPADFPEGHRQIKKSGRRWVPRWFAGREPVAAVTFAEAQAYARWLSEKWGGVVRLPTENEWEQAARGGIDQAPYPWGWEEPEGKAVFKASRCARVGSKAPSAFGLFDMAGNVFEWCQPSLPVPAGKNVARGGSWAERQPEMLTVFRRTFFAADYRDADVGFRIAIEAERPAE